MQDRNPDLSLKEFFLSLHIARWESCCLSDRRVLPLAGLVISVLNFSVEIVAGNIFNWLFPYSFLLSKQILLLNTRY